MQCIHAPRIHFKVLPALLSVAVCISLMGSGYAQCFTSNQFPENSIPASPFANVETVISTESKTGFYHVISNLQVGKNYEFNSTGLGDFVTVRINGGNAGDPPIDFGPTPLSFTATSDILEFHLTLVSPPCDKDALTRTTSIVCTDCSEEPARVGVNNANPDATLDVNGNLKIGDGPGLPEAGMIRYNATTNDFEGYNGQKWLSLTRSASSWGRTSVSNSSEDDAETSLDGNSNDRLGSAVSISGNYAIAGAPLADVDSISEQGACYIFVRSGTDWSEQAKLIADDGAVFNRFGTSVSISGNYAIVGAPGRIPNSNPGAAYVFVRSGTNWTQQAKITANDGMDEDLFGVSVSISGSYAIVGAERADINSNSRQGASYVYLRSGTNWIQQAKLTADDGVAFDAFGASVSISGQYAIIGAPDKCGGICDPGAAYVFIRSNATWTQQEKLTPFGGDEQDFGQSVSISGDYGIVGSRDAAYIVARSDTNWIVTTNLMAAEQSTLDNFGTSVSISGDYAIVGSSTEDYGQNINQGASYIFVKRDEGWAQQVRLEASDRETADYFGSAVAISGEQVIVGAPYWDNGSTGQQGAVYFFCQK